MLFVRSLPATHCELPNSDAIPDHLTPPGLSA